MKLEIKLELDRNGTPPYIIRALAKESAAEVGWYSEIDKVIDGNKRLFKQK